MLNSENTKLLSSELASKATIIGNCGAVSGGIIAGYFSQYTGRRLAAIIMLIVTAAFIPLWIIPNSFSGCEYGTTRFHWDSLADRISQWLPAPFVCSLAFKGPGVLFRFTCPNPRLLHSERPLLVLRINLVTWQVVRLPRLKHEPVKTGGQPRTEKIFPTMQRFKVRCIVRYACPWLALTFCHPRCTDRSRHRMDIDLDSLWS